MSEEQKPVQNDVPDENDFRPVLTIEVDRAGRIRVMGCVNDITASYGLLEIAKDQIREHNRKRNESKIIKTNGHGIMDFVRGIGK